METLRTDAVRIGAFGQNLSVGIDPNRTSNQTGDFAEHLIAAETKTENQPTLHPDLERMLKGPLRQIEALTRRIFKQLKITELPEETQKELHKLKDSTEKIESIFLKDLLKSMRNTVPKSLTDDSPMAGLAKDWFDQAIADQASKTGSLGLANTLFRTLAETTLRKGAATQKLKKIDLES